jgi:hypothetical protein
MMVSSKDRNMKMNKVTLSTLALVVALSTSAFASGLTWNVTEENSAGIKSGQGQWSVTIDGNNKLSGSAVLNFDSGKTLTYDLSGTKGEAAYTVSLLNRSDGKIDCVWSGHSPANVEPRTHGFIGQVQCDGNKKFLIRAGF